MKARSGIIGIEYLSIFSNFFSEKLSFLISLYTFVLNAIYNTQKILAIIVDINIETPPTFNKTINIIFTINVVTPDIILAIE